MTYARLREEALLRLTAPGQPYELMDVIAHDRIVRAFANAPPTLKQLYASARSEKTFIVYESERLTFEETWQRACTLACALVEECGVEPGDRIAIAMRNYPEWMIAFMAVTSIGAIAVGLNAHWTPAEIEYGLLDSAPWVLICDQERFDRYQQCVGPLPDMHVIVVRNTKPMPPGARTWDEILWADVRTEMPEVMFGPDDDALMFYTSAASGSPKGAVSTHRAVLNSIISSEFDTRLGVEGGLLAPPPPDAPQLVSLLGIPLFHVTGCHVVFLGSFRPQRRLVCMYKWDPEKAAALIERERVNVFMAPSAVTGDLLAESRTGRRDLSSLMLVGGGGAPRAPAQVRDLSQAFGPALPATGWGMTETNAAGSLIGYRDYLEHPDSSGLISAVMDVRIVDDDGVEVPVGERGELQIRGVCMMRCYWNRSDTNNAAYDGEWFRTGDVACMNEDGYLFIVDRIKDMVLRGGENIACAFVEGVLEDHPAVREACVFGVPDERLGEEVAATVFADRPVTADELRAFLATRIAKYQIPRWLHVSLEPLERGPSGKILKRQIRLDALERLKAKVKA
jgi:long-chain acyl-CoA synthetase